MVDLIDRQAALDVVSECCGICIQRIVDLPSAQPEIIRCNSCKHWTQAIGKMRGFGLGRCNFHDAEYVTCNGFCYWAERRENG